MKKTDTSETSKKILITKEKYDNLWNHFFYCCLALTLVGIYFMIRGVNNFRNTLISLNPNYEFSKYSDFKKIVNSVKNTGFVCQFIFLKDQCIYS